MGSDYAKRVGSSISSGNDLGAYYRNDTGFYAKLNTSSASVGAEVRLVPLLCHDAGFHLGRPLTRNGDGIVAATDLRVTMSRSLKAAEI